MIILIAQIVLVEIVLGLFGYALFLRLKMLSKKNSIISMKANHKRRRRGIGPDRFKKTRHHFNKENKR